MSDRILGAVCVVTAAGMAWAAQGYAAAISYEPVGPRAFPLLLSALMGIAGLWLMIRPTLRGSAISLAHVKPVALAVTSVFAYAFLFEKLGFPVATALMAVPVGMAFGGEWKRALLGGVGMGVGMFILFDKLLDVVLPTGVLSFLLGGR